MRIAPFLLALAVSAATPSQLEEALNLKRQGKLPQASNLLKTITAQLRASGDKPNLARAVGIASELAISLGDYRGAITYASEETALRFGLSDQPGLAEARNTLGLAYLYLADYPAALENYQLALNIDRAIADSEGQNIRLNNIGNVYYFEGRYLEALEAYNQALAIVNNSASGQWRTQRTQITITNLATLYQRLGKEPNALALYRQVAQSGQAMTGKERAQLLLNQGALYRRMGDPVKAIALYKSAQTLFAAEHNSDGEIGAQRNIGIAQAADLNDLAAALQSFSAARELARLTSNGRSFTQANLYRSEVLRRLHRLPEAEKDAKAALDGATSANLKEEQWKALYALGKIAADSHLNDLAFDCYRQAMTIIESVRQGLQRAILRSDFLADKREVYDAMISLRLQSPTTGVAELFSWLERSRSRTLRDRLAPIQDPSLAAIQSKLPPRTMLVEYWMGNGQTIALWINTTGSGIVKIELPPEQIALFIETAQNPTKDWRAASRSLGKVLLSNMPRADHWIVVPDGPLSALPFEALIVPGTDTVLIESSDVSYLPSAQLLLRQLPPASRWTTPWNRQLVAFGDPVVPPGETLLGAERLPRLLASAAEVQGIAAIVGGRSELHLGTDAQKSYLANGRLRGLPLLHFSTHGIADTENPDRSRILLASNFMFQEEVYNLDLTGVGLVTLSACDTGRGKFIGGEGVEAFPRAFLAAGANATITSLWRVADAPTAEFMQQLYFFLNQGQSKAKALQSAKLSFLHSNSALSNPRHWAAFVLNGEGEKPTARAIPWSGLLILGAGLLTVASGFIWKRQRQMA